MEDDVMTMKQAIVTGLSAAGLVLAGGLSWAAGQYGPGASDTEIKIGNTVPYSGPASAYGTIGKSEAAYFAMINDQGGINGRKVNFLSRDDSYSPPKTLEEVRKLVEEDQVLLMFGALGTPPNTAIQGYLNDNKVPQLFVTTGANKWNDPKHHPWTMGWIPTYQTEARIYARYILKTLPLSAHASLSGRQPAQDGLGSAARPISWRPVVQLDCSFGSWGEDHLPGQIRDLSRPQPGLDRQQRNQPVTQGMSGCRSEDQQVIGIVF